MIRSSTGFEGGACSRVAKYDPGISGLGWRMRGSSRREQIKSDISLHRLLRHLLVANAFCRRHEQVHLHPIVKSMRACFYQGD